MPEKFEVRFKPPSKKEQGEAMLDMLEGGVKALMGKEKYREALVAMFVGAGKKLFENEKGTKTKAEAALDMLEGGLQALLKKEKYQEALATMLEGEMKALLKEKEGKEKKEKK